MDIERLIIQMSKDSNYEVKKPNGQPSILDGHVLPDDLQEFYRLCGGVSCYIASGGFPINVLAPAEVKPANLELIGESCPNDISSSWYLIADALDGNYISIDFAPERLGRCYESFEYSHAVAGNCPIVALSFTQFLQNLFDYKGDYFFWKDINHSDLGDAYKVGI